jgi:DNA-binding transcriptional LysR family regulator
MDFEALKVFLAVARERSFSRAAAKVHRTQPAVSQAVRRLEADLGEELFDRSSKNGTLTDAGRTLQNYGDRLVRLAEETESAMRALRDLRRGRVLIGANEAAVHTLLPLIGRFRLRYPDIAIDVRRVPARQIAVEVQQGSLDLGALTFHPGEPGLQEVSVGTDELVLLVQPSHPLAKRRQVTMEEVASEPIIAHNDPSPARDRVLRLFEQHHLDLNMVISLPSLDGIKRAVELELGVALLPRRCAVTEIAGGRLVAIPVSGLSRRRLVTLVCRRAHRSHAAAAFLALAEQAQGSRGAKGQKGDLRASSDPRPEGNALAKSDV